MAPNLDPGPQLSRLIQWLTLCHVLLLWVQMAASHAAVTSTITGDGTLGTTVTQSGRIYAIGGGTLRGSNLFQSFDRFTVGTGDTAAFTGPTGTRNILSRVTGGQPSTIDGILRSEITGANLYLLNPSGVLFGPNASLAVSGSFHVSTADVLRFTDEATFSAHLGQASTLTMADPVAFGFLGSNPTAITIQGSRLEVPAGQVLSVVGGDIEIVGRGPLTASIPTLGAARGRIQLASVAAPGEVGFSPLELAPDLQVDRVAQLGRIALSQGAFVDASGNGGGVVLLRGGRLFVDHAAMFADNNGPLHGAGVGLDLAVRADAVIRNGAVLTTDSLGAGRARDLRLTAGHLHLDNAVIGSRSNPGAAGDSGHVMVRVGTLTLTGGAQLDSSTQLGATGHGGRLTVTATDAITITGLGSELVNVARGTGRVGEIAVEARRLTLTGGAEVRNHAFSIDHVGGGRVTLTATEAVVIAGESSVKSSVSSSGPITIRAPTVRLAAGNVGNPAFSVSDAADIVITAGQVTLSDGALITSRTLGAGRGGEIRLQGDRVTLTGGATITSQTVGSGEAATGSGGHITITATDVVAVAGPASSLLTGTQSRGSGGNITLQAREIRLTAGAALSAVSAGAGDAGRLTLTATEHLRLDHSTLTASNDPHSRGDAGRIVIHAPAVTIHDGRIEAQTRGPGRGGDIELRVGRLTLAGGGAISTSTSGSGSGGQITLTATDLLTLTGQNSGLFSQAQGSGGGGDLTLQAREVRLTEGAAISALSAGAGDAGRLTLTATEHLRLDHSTLTAQATQADGGVIVLQAGHGVQLWDGSTITASVEGGPTTVGGNLTITAPFVVLEGSQEGRQIIAQATKGAGGRIVITSPVLLAEPTLADPTGQARVSASSTEGGISGLVDIRAPVTTLSGAVAPLPQAFVNVATLWPARCAARLSGGTYSSLVVGGRGGLPLEPGGVLPSPLRLDAQLAAGAAGGAGQGRRTPPEWGALLAAEEQGFPRLRGADALGLAPAVREGVPPDHGHGLRRGCFRLS